MLLLKGKVLNPVERSKKKGTGNPGFSCTVRDSPRRRKRKKIEPGCFTCNGRLGKEGADITILATKCMKPVEKEKKVDSNLTRRKKKKKKKNPMWEKKKKKTPLGSRNASGREKRKDPRPLIDSIFPASANRKKGRG